MVNGVVAAVLRGDPTAWAGAGREWTEQEFLTAAEQHGIVGLLAHALRARNGGEACPAALRREIQLRSWLRMACEELRRAELRRVLDGFERAGIRPILLKGTALAYVYYPHPSLRERTDTDVLIPSDDRPVVEDMLEALGYERHPFPAGSTLSQQALFRVRDGYGLQHDLDVHWRISNRPLLMNLVSYGELAARAHAVPLLHRWAMGPCALDALLLASVHRVGHHNNAVELGWLFDIDLLARHLGRDGLTAFRRLAEQKAVSAVCAEALHVTSERLSTLRPHTDWIAEWRAEARRGNEPSALYLTPAPWVGDQAISDCLTQPDWSTRIRFVREILFPDARYMLARYGVTHQAMVPLLHARRLLAGVWSLAGRLARDLTHWRHPLHRVRT